jgi:hypothetical protein
MAAAFTAACMLEDGSLWTRAERAGRNGAVYISFPSRRSRGLHEADVGVLLVLVLEVTVIVKRTD